jgi:cysteine-rich repeat protein
VRVPGIAPAGIFGLVIGCAVGGPSPEGPGLAATEESSTGGSVTATSRSSSSSDDPASGPDSSAGPGSAVCGDGNQDLDEECDDGNQTNADGCNADCRVSGQLLWADTIGSGFGFVEDGMAVAAAADGTVFVAGYVTNAAEARDAWVRRYSAYGEPLWTQTHAGAGGANDEIRGLLLDDGGNLFATGYQSTASTGLDAWLRTYNLQGGEVWTRTYDGPASTTDVFHAASFDAVGNLVVGGYHGVTGEGADVLLRKYTTEGDVLWTRTYSGGNGGNDLIWDVATSAAGHVYVAGYETGTTGEGLNAWLAKYDTDGNAIWTRSYNGAASLDDYFVGVEVIGDDDVVVCGYEAAVEYPWHSFVRRYDSFGMIAWTDEYAGEGGEGAHCFGIAADSDDNLVTTGGEIVAGIRGVLLRKYDAAGSVWWSQVIPGGGIGPDYGRRVAIGPEDTIVVSGAVDSGVDARDIWVGVLTP